jgi:hypothetical protein
MLALRSMPISDCMFASCYMADDMGIRFLFVFGCPPAPMAITLMFLK